MNIGYPRLVWHDPRQAGNQHIGAKHTRLCDGGRKNTRFDAVATSGRGSHLPSQQLGRRVGRFATTRLKRSASLEPRATARPRPASLTASTTQLRHRVSPEGSRSYSVTERIADACASPQCAPTELACDLARDCKCRGQLPRKVGSVFGLPTTHASTAPVTLVRP